MPGVPEIDRSEVFVVSGDFAGFVQNQEIFSRDSSKPKLLSVFLATFEF
jgi:hypothetical protein